jgi:hypothetical protein
LSFWPAAEKKALAQPSIVPVAPPQVSVQQRSRLLGTASHMPFPLCLLPDLHLYWHATLPGRL